MRRTGERAKRQLPRRFLCWPPPHPPKSDGARWISLDLNADCYPTAWCRSFAKNLKRILQAGPLSPFFGGPCVFYFFFVGLHRHTPKRGAPRFLRRVVAPPPAPALASRTCGRGRSSRCCARSGASAQAHGAEWGKWKPKGSNPCNLS